MGRNRNDRKRDTRRDKVEIEGEYIEPLPGQKDLFEPPDGPPPETGQLELFN